MNKKLLKLVKDNPVVIPRYIFQNYKKLNITEEELIILIYLINYQGKILYDPDIFVKELNLEKFRVMELINSLMEKKMLSFSIEKNDNICEEYINIDMFYDHIIAVLVEESTEEKPIESDIFLIFEKELGRTLSPMEYEIIKGWIEEHISQELIIEALKEAVYNGVNNFRYIDKILRDWKKKNINTKEQIQLEKSRFHYNKKETKEVFDYNWLDDE